MDIQRFRDFCRTRFRLEEQTQHLSDARASPKIGIKTIFAALFYMGVFGLGSLLGLDQYLRTSKGKKLFGSSQPVVSDSTLARSLAGFALAPLHAMLEAVYAAGRRVGVGRCTLTHTPLRIGAIDGSCFGKFQASCFAEIGAVSLMGGLEPISKRGKELPASKKLVKKLVVRFGKRFVDLVLLDALYVAQDFLRTCLAGEIDFLIKTQEARLAIIQDAMGLFRHYADYAQDIEHIQGTDIERMRAYDVYALEGFFLDGVDALIKVAWVVEENLRTGETIEFWVLTSLQTLTAEEMRQLAHWRWDIENNGFKTLNALVHTKHLYAHDKHAAEAVTLTLFIAGNILQLFLDQISLQEIHDRFGKVKPTRRFLQGELRDSVQAVPVFDTS